MRGRAFVASLPQEFSMKVQSGNNKTIILLAGFKKKRVKIHPGSNEVDKKLWSSVVGNYGKERLNKLRLTY